VYSYSERGFTRDVHHTAVASISQMEVSGKTSGKIPPRRRRNSNSVQLSWAQAQANRFPEEKAGVDEIGDAEAGITTAALSAYAIMR
jgi:hypothetical protein